MVTNTIEDRLEDVRVLGVLTLGVARGPTRLVGRRQVARLQDTRNALHGDLLDALAEARQAGVHLPDLVLLHLDETLQNLLLFANNSAELCVHYLGVQLAA